MGALSPHWAGLGSLGVLPRRGGLWDRDGGNAGAQLDVAESPLATQARSPLAVSAAGDRAAPSPKMMENKVFMSFTFYSTILILKMYVVAIITGQVRLRKKAFANPEDALRNGGLQYYREDPDVERCRRAHRNDMENIFPFLFLGAVYSLLDPSPAVARIHFFIFCVGRIIHTVAYLLQLKAPTRSVAYGVAQLPCFSMALQILLATTPYW
ncbi:LOW QUALITY PROTEIN: prostaglandin E synthase [Gavia stellata]|uniref:LOW QUALITY PROTEIN: prostaglandin E synthase n=1 Tax=Gavia stellata TaxID=37040 RepID=UPI002897AF6F|nr:LOW QUALITY PROTEIN: prostaglandin E synthase [Gavia stellata]